MPRRPRLAYLLALLQPFRVLGREDDDIGLKRLGTGDLGQDVRARRAPIDCGQPVLQEPLPSRFSSVAGPLRVVRGYRLKPPVVGLDLLTQIAKPLVNCVHGTSIST